VVLLEALILKCSYILAAAEPLERLLDTDDFTLA
jgi:hypothetical protein